MTESFPLKIGNKSRISTLTTAIQHCTGGSNRPIKQEKEIKGIQIGKKKAKLSLSAGELILHIQTLKEHTHTHACTHRYTTIRINEYIQQGCRKNINIQKKNKVKISVIHVSITK